MMNSLTKLSIKSFLVAFVMLFAFMGNQQVKAQPGGYCMIWPPPDGYTYTYCGTFYGWITEFKVVESGTGTTVFDRRSASDNCQYWGSDEINLKIGRSYDVYITHAVSYTYYNRYSSCRFYIDWNMNGNWLDQGEYLGYKRGSYTTSPHTYQYHFTVPCSVTPGKTRVRALAGYYYYNSSSNPCQLGWIYAGRYYYVYGEAEDYVFNFIPDMEGQFPAQDDILDVNTDYDGSDASHPKPYAEMGATQPSGTSLNYKITGPRPSNNIVYEAIDPNTGSIDVDMGGYSEYTIQAARGPYAGNNGDGTFRGTRGGEYKVAIVISGSGCPGASYATFTVSWDNDLASNEIQSPRSNAAPAFYKYPQNIPIQVRGVFQNVGKNAITEFWAYAYIVNSDGDTIGTFQRHWDADNGDRTLNATEKATISFGTIRIREVGVFKVYLYCDLLSAVDQEEFNDYLPRQGDDDYTFEVAYDIQLQSSKMFEPAQGQVVIGNRPVIPKGMFKNVGIYDASDVPARLNIYKLPNMDLAYSSSIIVQDVPSGRYNTKTEQFEVMTLRETGDYEAELIITHEDDEVRSDDTLRIRFSVEGGLCGTYTVGAGGDFPTIDSLMNTLYHRGIACSCTFVFTDSYYRVSGEYADQPAWDFTTTILGLGWNEDEQELRTITFKPSQRKSLTKGSITVDLVSPNGNGVVFGQSMTPSNEYSVYYEYQNYGSIARQYVNFPGYVTFDGGSQKSFKFRTVSYSEGTANAFYFGRGTKHVTVKNVIIENATPSLECKTHLPMTSYNPTNGFGFQPDTILTGSSVSGYSAGIVNRSTLFGTELAQLLRVDTIPNTDNVITGNEIHGFGYGIVTLGIGQLLLENEGDYARFYNKHNEISNNIIYDICKAGIVAGYEEESVIESNRIYAVNNDNASTGGIIAGGFGTSMFKGYNNVKLSILSNEISDVSSGIAAAGIRVEQAQNVYQHPSLGQVYFPDVAEETKVANNAIWSLTTTDEDAPRAGIMLLTERGVNLWTPKDGAYQTRNDMIVNNTVILGSNGSISSIAPNAAFSLQSVSNATFMNNAIALTDMGIGAGSDMYCGIFYQGVMPEEGGMTSDYNVFYAADGSHGSFASFIEADEDGSNIEFGGRYDYQTINQWRNWTGEDFHSVEGNFLNDMEYTGTAPRRNLRVKTTPAPMGSLLNNRGYNFDWLESDIDGETRGAAGQHYDIGHDEFNGRLYLSDVEALFINEPAAYQTGTGFFSDAEYVMTTVPIEVKGLIRNSGNLPQNSITLTLTVYRELPNGEFSTVPELTTTAEASAQSGVSIEVPFNLADGTDPDFSPKTYAEWRVLGEPYVPADEFMTMMANITPRYKIQIGIQADQHNQNNIMTKIVRFYIRKSDMRILASVENSMLNLDQNSTEDEIAGRLNADSLFAALGSIGWTIDLDDARYDYDVFDRAGWEPKSVNYTIYRTIWWADGGDKPLTRYQRFDIYDFLDEGNTTEKRNLIISSQDIVREHSMNNAFLDEYFTGNILRSMYVAPGNPLGAAGNNDGNSVIGVALHRNVAELIAATGYAGDANPECGLVEVSSTGEGLARATAYYTDHSGAPSDSLSGVAATTLTRNVITMGVDWRHWANNEDIIRTSVDFIEKNGGTIIPVELTDFDARAIGRRVELNWRTASEYNSDKFEIERTVKTDAGIGIFNKIGEEKASGRSASPTTYGPIVDNNVEMGTTYVYRLKMIDLTGEYEYSDTREVKIGEESGAWLGDAMPNPVATTSELEFSANGAVTIELYDLTGKLVKVLFDGTVSGANTITIDASQLTSGRYNVVLRSADVTLTRNINVVR